MVVFSGIMFMDKKVMIKQKEEKRRTEAVRFDRAAWYYIQLMLKPCLNIEFTV